MEGAQFEYNFLKVVNKFLKHGIQPSEAEQMVAELLQHSWVKKLMVFSDQFIVVTDLKTAKYLFISPSFENVLGYKPVEFSNLFSMGKILGINEMDAMPKLAKLAFTKIASLNYSLEDLRKLRFSRNNWYIRKDGTPINILQHSMGLVFDEQGMIQLEFLIASDITNFNNSPVHFYKLTKMEDNGTEEILLQGVLEQDSITPREREIYSLLTLGKTSEEIAAQLNISTETVKSHRKNLLEKTQSENSIDLLRYGYAQGWL